MKVFMEDSRYRTEPIEIESSGIEIKFVIEIWVDVESNSYFSKVYRAEYFRLNICTFDEHIDCLKFSDEEIFVEDTNYDWSSIKSESREYVLEGVLDQIRNIFVAIK